jgi:hypothetical protein
MVATSEFKGPGVELVPPAKKVSFRVEREFGFVVGGIFTLLGAWWVYRGKFELIAPVFLTVGVLLVLLGASFPKALVLPNRGWMKLAEALSFVSTRVILAVVFFLVVTPIGVIKRSLGWDPLRRRALPEPSYWKKCETRRLDSNHYEKMY